MADSAEAQIMQDIERAGGIEPYARTRTASEVRPEPVEFAWDGRWPLKSVSLMVGVPGVNKTMAALERAARITRGQLDGDLHGSPRSVVVGSAEDSPAHTLVPRLMAAGADLDLVHFVTMHRDGFDGDISLPADIQKLADITADLAAAVVIIDPLTAHLGAEVNSHRDQDVRRALGPLARMADRTGCAVVCIVHTNKSPSTDLFMRVSGSIGISAAARSILVVATDPEAGEELGYKRVIVHGKCNVAPYAPTLRFEVEGRKVRGFENEEIDTAGIVWKGVAEGIGPRDVLGSEPHEREAPKRDAAEELLRDVLATGPMKQSDIEAAAKAEGISWATVRRAKDDLGIVTEQVRELGRLGAGPSYWSFPDPGDPPDDDLGCSNPISHEMSNLVSAGQGGDSDQVAHLIGDKGNLNEPPRDDPPRPFPFRAKLESCEVCGGPTFYQHDDGRMLCPRCKRVAS